MKIHDVEQGTDEWLALRDGKLTGTNSKNVVGYKEMLKADLIGVALDKGLDFDEKKIKVDELKMMIEDADPEFSFRVMEIKFNKDFQYKMLAKEVAKKSEDLEEDENPLQRGHDLEPMAIALFEKRKGVEVETVGFVSLDEEERVGLSPDGMIKNGGVYTAGVEVKSPCTWKYLKYWIEDVFPEEYKEQCLDYFVQSDDIQTVYLVLHNPRIDIHPLHIFELHRVDFERDIRIYKQAQIDFWKAHDRKLEEIKLLANSQQ